MQDNNHEIIDRSSVPGGKFGLALLLAVFLLLICAVPYGLQMEFSKLKMLELLPAAIKIKSGSVPLLVLLPTLLIFTWAVTKRWGNRYTTKDANLVVKTAAINFPIMIITFLGYKWYVSNYLSNHGYISCGSYTGASIYAAGKVWVRQSEYCLKEASIVSVDLVDWAEEQARLGNVVTVEQLQNKANELLKNSPFKQ